MAIFYPFEGQKSGLEIDKTHRMGVASVENRVLVGVYS